MKKKINLLLCSAIACSCLIESGVSMDKSIVQQVPQQSLQASGTIGIRHIGTREFPVPANNCISELMLNAVQQSLTSGGYQIAMQSLINSFNSLNTFYTRALDLMEMDAQSIDTLKVQNAGLNKQIDELNKDKDFFKTNFHEKDQNINSLNENIKKLKDENNSQKVEMEKLNGQIASLTKEKENLETQSDANKKTIENLNQDLKKLKDENNSQKVEMEKLNGQIVSLTKEKENLETQSEADKKTIQGLNNKLTEEKDTIEKLQEDLKSAKQSEESEVKDEEMNKIKKLYGFFTMPSVTSTETPGTNATLTPQGGITVDLSETKGPTSTTSQEGMTEPNKEETAEKLLSDEDDNVDAADFLEDSEKEGKEEMFCN